MTELPHVEAFTDGACKGNPGPGGWGVVLRMGTTEKELAGGEAVTTNNRMELTAAIQALLALKRPCRVAISTDSRYVMDGLTKWIHGWRRNGWRTADKKPVKNAELWQALIEASAPHRVEWTWVKGHAGHPENERADKLASDAAKGFANPPRNGEGDRPRASGDGGGGPAPGTPSGAGPLRHAAAPRATSPFRGGVKP